MLWAPQGRLCSGASPYGQWVCWQGLLPEALELGLQGGHWWKITDLIWVLSSLAVRHNEI